MNKDRIAYINGEYIKGEFQKLIKYKKKEHGKDYKPSLLRFLIFQKEHAELMIKFYKDRILRIEEIKQSENL